MLKEQTYEAKSLKMVQNKNMLKSTANILKAINNSRKFKIMGKYRLIKNHDFRI